ncbi:alkane 1-monooxygenase [Flavobacteriaceae bacterium]|jgi:alkane 1-monooxygenase|nr:alkane 1-monooxygenase [Flavobacteriaceae bacterium]
MKDLKYLFAYTVPLSVFISFESNGIGTYSAVLYAFIVLPIFDLIFGEDSSNLNKEDALTKKNKWLFDLMLYLNLPLVFGLLFHLFSKFEQNEYMTFEIIGLGLSAGILLATNGINVAHELGHRKAYINRFISKCLYMPCLYMHFYIEHNFGHHLNVATIEDGATAKYNQSLYSFWVTSVSKQYVDAWRHQMQLLNSQKLSFISIKNDMLWYHLIQPIYLILVGYVFSLNVMFFAICIAIVSFLFLESINYIEHYGLKRFKGSSGRYERVQPYHSWNSNFNIGRIVLYELTRHSDHHYKSSKKYQILESYKDSPTLPLGYPASILLSFIPPLWFFIINPLVPGEMKKNS